MPNYQDKIEWFKSEWKRFDMSDYDSAG
jgi:hypothetical protein